MLWKGFQKPKRLATDTESLTDKYGHFWAQPFERGFGTTIGNALRRVLLSSIEGAAVTAVKIEGVLHEFQSIPGVVEDATDIILNLKQIPFRLNGDAPKAIYLRADQPGVVTKHLELATKMMRTNTGLHADQARRQVGKALGYLATRPFLMQHDGAALIVAHDVESILADIDTDYGDCSVEYL